MSEPVFYFDTNSPYAYLAAERIGELIPTAVWRPIAFGILIRQIGKTPWSFGETSRPEGIAEITARAARRGLPPVVIPEGWPVGTYTLGSLRAALYAEEEGRASEFALAAFRQMFVAGRSLDEPETVRAAATSAGLDPDAAVAANEREDLKERLRASTDDAAALGVTGVPTVVVGDRMFWGDDRLDEAAAAVHA